MCAVALIQFHLLEFSIIFWLLEVDRLKRVGVGPIAIAFKGLETSTRQAPGREGNWVCTVVNFPRMLSLYELTLLSKVDGWKRPPTLDKAGEGALEFSSSQY